METKPAPTADDQFDGFETANPPPFTIEELKKLLESRQQHRFVWWTRQNPDPDFMLRLDHEARRAENPQLPPWDDLPEKDKEEIRDRYRLRAAHIR